MRLGVVADRHRSGLRDNCAYTECQRTFRRHVRSVAKSNGIVALRARAAPHGDGMVAHGEGVAPQRHCIGSGGLRLGGGGDPELDVLQVRRHIAHIRIERINRRTHVAVSAILAVQPLHRIGGCLDLAFGVDGGAAAQRGHGVLELGQVDGIRCAAAIRDIGDGGGGTAAVQRDLGLGVVVVADGQRIGAARRAGCLQRVADVAVVLAADGVLGRVELAGGAVDAGATAERLGHAGELRDVDGVGSLGAGGHVDDLARIFHRRNRRIGRRGDGTHRYHVLAAGSIGACAEGDGIAPIRGGASADGDAVGSAFGHLGVSAEGDAVVALGHCHRTASLAVDGKEVELGGFDHAAGDSILELLDGDGVGVGLALAQVDQLLAGGIGFAVGAVEQHHLVGHAIVTENARLLHLQHVDRIVLRLA